MTGLTAVENYINSFPKETQVLLEEMRTAIKDSAPEAEESIKYAIPTFTLHGNLVHYAAFKHHIGFYPGPTGLEAFKTETAGFKGAKGSIQFPLNEALPLELVRKIVAFRVKENIEKHLLKKQARTCKAGHRYFKTSDCPVCPTCQKELKTPSGFFTRLSAPARRALEAQGIFTPVQLSKFTEKEVLSWHGLGKASLPTLSEALTEQGLEFKK